MSDKFKHSEYERRLAREDYAIVLDYMPNGNPMDRHHPAHRTKPIAQAIGDKFFTLMEFYPKIGVLLRQGERVYVSFRNRMFRDKVDFVWGGPVLYDDLTSVARSFLPEALKNIVLRRELVFVEFFNVAAPLTIKLHSLELLPGIGKKTMWLVLEERRKKQFESFKDIQERTKIADPVKIIVERLLIEIKGEDRYYLFVEPPPGTANTITILYLPKLYRLIEKKYGERIRGEIY
jgi:putative nucleotide binding protein